MENEFTVWWEDPQGHNHKEREWINAGEAVQLAHSLAHRPATDFAIKKIIITDASDFTVFLWEQGRGVVYPNADVNPAAARHDH